MDKDLAQTILHQVRDNYNSKAEEFSSTREKNWDDLKPLGKYVKNDMRILDAGCGNGRLRKLFEDKIVEYVGLDNSEKLLEEAKKRIEMEPLPNVSARFLAGDLFALPFSNNEFDIVFCIAALHHVPSVDLRNKTMEEFRRVLRPGGILIMTNWNLYQPKYRPYIYKSTIDKLLWRNKMDFGDVMLKPFGVTENKKSDEQRRRYHHAFTKWGVEKILRRAGFKIRDCYYSKQGQKTGWSEGRNLIAIGQRYPES